ncbi:MAG: hypothetical protein II070_06650, partial [Treponema sp.]|nr:hypothetical protein [Treponema sp.]
QYAECLRHAGHGITIATLFYIAKQYGIDGRSDGTSAIFAPSPKNSISKTSKISKISKISNTADVADEADELRQGEGQPLPTFSQAIRSRLPKILQRVVEDSISDTDADLLILGSVTVFSACIPNVSGIYGRREVFSNLFLFPWTMFFLTRNAKLKTRNLMSGVTKLFWLWRKAKRIFLRGRI